MIYTGVGIRGHNTTNCGEICSWRVPIIMELSFSRSLYESHSYLNIYLHPLVFLHPHNHERGGAQTFAINKHSASSGRKPGKRRATEQCTGYLWLCVVQVSPLGSRHTDGMVSIMLESTHTHTQEIITLNALERNRRGRKAEWSDEEKRRGGRWSEEQNPNFFPRV